jgi:hypothetical protein
MDTRTGEIYDMHHGETAAELARRTEFSEQEIRDHFVEVRGSDASLERLKVAVQAGEKAKRRAAGKRARAARKRGRQ